MVIHARAAALGLLADRLLGEPPSALHPVARFGQVMEGVEERLYADDRASGIAHAGFGVAIGVAAGRMARSTALATWSAVAGKALGDAALAVGAALEADDLPAARTLLPSLVGRDPSELEAKEIARAVVESVAENTIDAVVAPALWAAVAGAPGVLAHRAVNTMDAMVGHRSDRYTRYGWAAARLDDAAAWVPARVGAGLVAVCRPRRAPVIWQVVRRDAAAHPSPNGGVIESAFAAALGVRLGGESSYAGRFEMRPALGDGRACEREDIARAVRLSRDVTVALGGVLIVLGARWGRGERR